MIIGVLAVVGAVGVGGFVYHHLFRLPAIEARLDELESK